MQTQFASREVLLTYVTEFSRAQGYAVVIHKSNVPRGQLWLRCDLGGAVPSPTPATSSTPPTTEKTFKRKRKASVRLQNCPFQLYGRRLATGAWVLKVQNDVHTHPLASRKEDLVAHPTARRLTNAQKRVVLEMTDLGIRPAVIVERLQLRFPEKPIKVQDIYNARNHIRMERLAGREPFPEARERNEEDALEGSCLESNELQQVCATVMKVVPQWSAQRQTSFIHGVLGLLASHNDGEGASREQRDGEQEDAAAHEPANTEAEDKIV